MALIAFGAWYVLYYDHAATPAPTEQSVDARSDAPEALAAKRALVHTLPHFALIVLVFLVGSYVMVKVGRSVLARRERRGKSEYVDAWSSYRVSDEEIAAAAEQLGETDSPNDSSADDFDDPPQPPQ